MDPLTISIVLIAAFILIMGGLWIAIALMVLAGLIASLSGGAQTGLIAATSIWSSTNNWAITALPLFIWMAEILNRSKLSQYMFSGLAPWLSNIPGRLLHINILACGLFGAVSGSSAATTATIAKITVPELKSRGYDEKMAICTLAGSGTLGILIPPSVVLIIYGFATDTSIARLFVAGILPSLMLISLFMAYTAIWAILNKSKMPVADATKLSLKARVWESRYLIPVLTLIFLVIGSIYAGFATPTEAASLGTVGALVLSYIFGTLSVESFSSSLMATVRTSCFIIFIVMSASFLSGALSFSGIPQSLATTITALNLDVYMFIAVLTLLYLALGCFLDNYSMILLTMGVLKPVVENYGIDLVWFGIFLVITAEMAQITPPIGFNLFVLQNYTGKNLLYIAWAALPFFMLLLLAVILVTAFPQIILYLPGLVFGK